MPDKRLNRPAHSLGQNQKAVGNILEYETRYRPHRVTARRSGKGAGAECATNALQVLPQREVISKKDCKRRIGKRRMELNVLQVPVQFRVEPAVSDQLLVITLFGDPAAVENQNPVSLFYCRKAVGNDQRGAAVEKA